MKYKTVKIEYSDGRVRYDLQQEHGDGWMSGGMTDKEITTREQALEAIDKHWKNTPKVTEEIIEKT